MNKEKDMDIKRILVVDDEIDLREILQFNLENEGYHVEIASSGEEALEKLVNPFDLILLDIMMGEISGLKTADKIRKDLGLTTPIIFLTAKVTENDMLTGFSIGADDYITKPFSVKEVIARCKAVIRRSENGGVNTISINGELMTPNRLELGSLVIDLDNRDVSVDGEPLSLTKKEYEILALLLSASGRTFSREEILDKVWRDESYVLERTVDVHITRLRKKLADMGGCIVNRSGYGYSFKVDKK